MSSGRLTSPCGKFHNRDDAFGEEQRGHRYEAKKRSPIIWSPPDLMMNAIPANVMAFHGVS